MGVIWASWEIVTMPIIAGRPQGRHGTCGRHLLIFLINMTQQYHQDDATSNELFLATFSERRGLSFVLIPFNIGEMAPPCRNRNVGSDVNRNFLLLTLGRWAARQREEAIPWVRGYEPVLELWTVIWVKYMNGSWMGSNLAQAELYSD